MSGNYHVPAETLEQTLLVKKSRFIACATIIKDREQAMAFLQSQRDQYPDARHHCWAYLTGNPASASNAAMNDDGEPAGTAGKPILNVIQHKNIGDVMVVVSRYFGGVKLGAGGLTRAYSGATEMILSTIKLEQQVSKEILRLVCDFSQEQIIRHWASLHQAAVEILNYADQVELEITCPQKDIKMLNDFCLSNRIKIHKDAY